MVDRRAHDAFTIAFSGIPLPSNLGVVMRLSAKLPVAAAGLAVFSIAATSLASLSVSGSLSSAAAIEKLEALADARRNELRHYLTTIENDLRNLQAQKSVPKALSDLSTAMARIGNKPNDELQQRYVKGNPNPETQRAAYSSAGKDKYDALHARYHPFFRRFAEAHGYRDVLLANLNGDVVYSLNRKETSPSTLGTKAGRGAVSAGSSKRLPKGPTRTGSPLLPMRNTACSAHRHPHSLRFPLKRWMARSAY
ncbi:hypothetical protein [Sinorhizobium fredii]|uniref:hypothetical protein n=2 Tax=Rhizobium fredii TaxID=380 RepID=UPI0004B81288|nr:hypothetical protein [Sinorhizobium fredii]GEC35496.1 hypothetical protein EFR01_56670 [Sinorhizobium fredii]